MKKIIEWLQELPIEAKDKVYAYLSLDSDVNDSLDILNELEPSMGSAVFRCLPDPLDEPFEYWYNIIHTPI